MKPHLYVAISLSLLIGGCTTAVKQATLDPEQQYPEHIEQVKKISSWVLTGRLSIRNTEENWSGTLRWSQQNKDDFELHFSGPLGQGTILIKGSHRGVVLNASDGTTLSGKSVSELFDQRLGWPLPFEQLTYWVRGLPEPIHEHKTILDRSGRIAELNQSQWSIRYKAYTTLPGRNVALPKKVYLKKAPWQIKLIIDEWQYMDNEQG